MFAQALLARVTFESGSGSKNKIKALIAIAEAITSLIKVLLTEGSHSERLLP